MGATELAFGKLLVARYNEVLSGPRLEWLSNRGHLNRIVVEKVDSTRIEVLKLVYSALGGNEALLSQKTAGSDPKPDFVLPELQLLIEVDELQHFTSDRWVTLEHYPLKCVHDVGEYKEWIQRWRAKGDKYRAEKPAADFPFAGGRRAQRAYFDAVRDLLAPSFGLRVIRIPAPECDAELAFERFQRKLNVLTRA